MYLQRFCISLLEMRVRDNSKSRIQDKLPEEYQRCLTGINQVLKISWHIANIVSRE
jgi:hypothetical protein